MRPQTCHEERECPDLPSHSTEWPLRTIAVQSHGSAAGRAHSAHAEIGDAASLLHATGVSLKN
jgi:hypothetical protein